MTETLETRTLLAGNVVAAVQLSNTDGTHSPLPGWTVFVDINDNEQRDASDPQGVTGADGKVTITGVEARTWDVYEEVPAGFEPAPGFKNFDRVSVKDGRANNVSFLNVALPAVTNSIEGTVWIDANRDGVRDADDLGRQGIQVFLDLNTDRFFEPGEPTTTTDANGFYFFKDLAPDRYKVRVVTPSGLDPTLGGDGASNVDVTAGRTAVADFGLIDVRALGTIHGTVWNDVNADGFRAATDPGLGGWTLFLDLNSSGAPDAGEPTTLSDAAGVFTFESVTVGTYQVGEVVQAGWNTSPGHPALVTINVVNEGANNVSFANFTPANGAITGRVFNDADGNGSIGAGEAGLPGWGVFVDSDGDGALTSGEASATTDGSGTYLLSNVPVGSAVVREIPAVGWSPTAPGTGMQLVNVPNATTVSAINFGNKQRTDGAISGVAFFDANHNGTREAGERGLANIPVFLDANDNGVLDAGEPSVNTSPDLFYTPSVDETGRYEFTHLAAGTYHVREIVPDVLSATPDANRAQNVTLVTGEQRTGVNFADVYRPNEIRGVVYDDGNKNHAQDAGEPGIPGVTVYVDLNRNNAYDADEPKTVTAADGSYSFVTGLAAGSYVVRALHHSGREHTYPETTGGILWPAGVSNPTIGNVTPTSITTSLAQGQTEQHSVSLTLPAAGALTNRVDVFLLFDDTGSFTANSPIVRAAFPDIIATLQASMPGVDLGFGVGRFEEYANFALENPTGRPFILNQPIVSQSTPGFASAIQAALDRTAPGYGGDEPETDIEALYQMATGAGFDGNNNGTTSDSGAAGLVSTQLTPGDSGDVPTFASFSVDPSGNVLPASGAIGGAGFRPGALPIILTATDTGFAFQPHGETSVTGINGLTLPIGALTGTSRPTTPFNAGAGIQDTVTALNALGALVIGLGTNATANVDPRQGLESLAKLTGAVNRSAITIPNGTVDPIAPGDPMYFEISSGFGTSVASGIVTAIENAVSNVDVNLTVRASDPRVHLSSTPGVINNVGAGETATFDVTFTGDGRPHRFDLQFVRQGTDVVLGSIPVVIGTPISGDGYEYVELEDGEIHHSSDFGDSYDAALPVNVAPSFVKGDDLVALDDSASHSVPGWASDVSAGPSSDDGQIVDFVTSTDDASLFSAVPKVSPDGTLTFTPAPGASGVATVSVALHDSGGTEGGGADTSAVQTFTISVDPSAPLPAWVVATAADATWRPLSKTLKITGPATITLDPTGANAPIVTATGAAAVLTINPASGGQAVHLAALHLTDGANATLPSVGAALRNASNHRVLVIDSDDVVIDPTSTLDLADNDLVVHAAASPSPMDLRALLKSGYNGGTWHGTGIVSSVAAAPESAGNYTLALAENGLLTNKFGDGTGTKPLFDGQAVDDSTVLVKFTHRVDLDLDGVVGANDAITFSTNYTHSAVATWQTGDLDLDSLFSENDAITFSTFYNPSLSQV